MIRYLLCKIGIHSFEIDNPVTIVSEGQGIVYTDNIPSIGTIKIVSQHISCKHCSTTKQIYGSYLSN